jgi:hypothetical protein
MPVCYFDVREAGSLAADEEGIEQLDIEAAQESAARSLVDMARDALRRNSGDPARHNMAIEVRDVAGPVLQAKFTVAVDQPVRWGLCRSFI